MLVNIILVIAIVVLSVFWIKTHKRFKLACNWILGLMVVLIAVLVCNIVQQSYESKFKENTPLDVRVEITINYEKMNDVWKKNENAKKILINKKDTVKTFGVREPLKDTITIIMVQKDGSEKTVDFPMGIFYNDYIKFNTK